MASVALTKVSKRDGGASRIDLRAVVRVGVRACRDDSDESEQEDREELHGDSKVTSRVEKVWRWRMVLRPA